MAPDPDRSPRLDKKATRAIQSAVRSLLYYAWAVDPTMLPTLNEIGTRQATPTRITAEKLNMLLDYASTYQNAVIRYHASDMVLWIESDAAYLVLPNARSRYAWHYYLSSAPPLGTLQDYTPKPNGPIHTECSTIQNVVGLAAKAETAGVYSNAKKGVEIRRILHEMRHPQPATPLKTDNSTTQSFILSNIRQKRSKTWDMIWNWLREKATQKEFRFYWDKGINNRADYHTKHHPPAHHLAQRPRYILKGHHVQQIYTFGASLKHHISRVITNFPQLSKRVCSDTNR